MSVYEHPDPLLQTAQAVALGRLDDMLPTTRSYAYVEFAGRLPIGVDGTDDAVQEGLFLMEERVPVEAGEGVGSVGEETESIRGRGRWGRRGCIEDGLHDNEKAEGGDKRGHAGGRVGMAGIAGGAGRAGRAGRGRVVVVVVGDDAVGGDELVVDGAGLGEIAVAEADERGAAKGGGDLLVPDVDGPERAAADLVLDRAEAVVRVDGPVEAGVKGERDGLCEERKAPGEVAKPDRVDGGDKGGLDGVQRRSPGTREPAEAGKQLDPVGAAGERVGGLGADAGVVRVARGEAADGDDKGGEAWFAPFGWARVVVEKGGHVQEGEEVVRRGEVALHQVVHQVRCDPPCYLSPQPLCAHLAHPAHPVHLDPLRRRRQRLPVREPCPVAVTRAIGPPSESELRHMPFDEKIEHRQPRRLSLPACGPLVVGIEVCRRERTPPHCLAHALDVCWRGLHERRCACLHLHLHLPGHLRGRGKEMRCRVDELAP